jgi:translation initiation factor IF-2
MAAGGGGGGGAAAAAALAFRLAPGSGRLWTGRQPPRASTGASGTGPSPGGGGGPGGPGRPGGPGGGGGMSSSGRYWSGVEWGGDKRE